ncbi:MAG: nucleotidyl transferase AbiEii/AbiGii toxin family protein, partial [Gemmataceae bacterium]
GERHMAGELVLATLERTWEALRDQGIDACVMGGLALVHWGHARFTKDVDLLALLDPQAADKFAHALGPKGFVTRRTPALSQVGQHSFLQFLYSPEGRFDKVAVDLLLADSDFLRTALHRAVPFTLGPVESRVVSCEDLIILKLQAERLIDRNDVRYLLEYNRSHLDFTYLTDCIIKLGLMKEWAEWWENAFPGEPVPTGGS